MYIHNSYESWSLVAKTNDEYFEKLKVNSHHCLINQFREYLSFMKRKFNKNNFNIMEWQLGCALELNLKKRRYI